ncbi:uncharacterized protein AB675_9127 [Cyphellophora attinorum]|uniref:Zn(2)-C6 fungal-type domain-containing protein n=1 Tax=Cyphellophora attinorum TaxID=1664694 RepID=A0A0N0NNI6_9EURO|nr:uncharacterized protein AB675_9127 [Phialophora attinorum]KPI41419.1 hypothetical protein AB675_9127 [Phialophora attinorum]
MVGVAGRSKACGTCKARRIKCSLERPQCANCIKSNRFCSGYQRERVFFVNQIRHPGTFHQQKQPDSSKASPSDGSYDDNEPASLPVEPAPLAKCNSPFWKRKQKPTQHRKVHFSPRSLTVSSPTSISALPSHRQQLLALYLDTTFPCPANYGPAPLPWINHLALLSYYPPCLASAIDALTLSHLSRLAQDRAGTLEHVSGTTLAHAHDGMVFRQQSLSAYTTGLWHLQRALWSPAEMYEDTTLAACLVLALYELLECPAGSRVGYLAHQNGAARLVQLRGPAAHREAFAHSLFVAFRNGGILRALEQHEAGCFLAEKEWCTIPWEGSEGYRKGKGEEIWDFIALTPDVLAQTDVMQRAKPVRSLCIALSVLEYCWKTEAELEMWLEGLKEAHGGVLFWPVLVDEEHRDKEYADLFPVKFEFLNLSVAITLMSYWSLLVVVYNGMFLLYQVLQTLPVDRKAVKSLGNRAPPALLKGIAVDCPPNCPCGGEPGVECLVRFDISTLPPLEHRADFMTPVRNICQSVQYCSRPEMKSLGWSCVITPLGIAVDVIKNFPWWQREMKWMLGVLKGKAIALPYLKNLWWTQDHQGSTESSGEFDDLGWSSIIATAARA